MPTVFRQDGFRFFFYSNEGDPREPVHVHAMRGGSEAKFRLAPEVILAASAGSTPAPAGASPRWSPRVGGHRKGLAVSISAEGVRFDDDAMWVAL